MNSLISIIVPIYNVEEYLDRCISSIMNQTYSNLQILLIDDGSTDQSGYICDKYAKIDSRIQVIHQNNKGLVQARKIGLENAMGDYIAFVDGDDYVDEDIYEELLKNIIKHDADFVHSGYVEENDKRCRECISFQSAVLMLDIQNVVQALADNFLVPTRKHIISPSIWVKLFKKELISKCYNLVNDTQPYGEDVICLCACFFESKKISLVPIAKYHYNIRENSMSHNKDIINFIRKSKLYLCLEKLFKMYSCFEQLESALQTYYKNMLFDELDKMTDKRSEFVRFRFADIKKLYGKRIVLYGAGKVGRDYYADIVKYHQCNIVAWLDANYVQCDYEYYKVMSVDCINDVEYDYVIIAVSDKELASEIEEILISKDIPEEKIVWREPIRI